MRAGLAALWGRTRTGWARLCLALGVLALGADRGHAQTVLTASSWVPPGHVLQTTMADWCAQVEARSAQSVRCNLLPRAVSAPPGTFDAVRNGLADLSFTVHGYTPGRFLAPRLVEFPFLGNSAEALSAAYSKVAASLPLLAEEHRGVRLIALFTHGPGIVFNTKRPIASIDELGGLKFRVGGGMVNDIARALGMNATLKPSSESYELLSTGVMDGTLFPPESIEAFKLDRLVRYATVFPGGLYNTSFAFLMNQAAYDRLPAPGRAAVDAMSGEVAARMFGQGWDRVDQAAMAKLRDTGVAFADADPAFVSAVRERTGALEEAWIQAMEAKGATNARAVLAELRVLAARP